MFAVAANFSAHSSLATWSRLNFTLPADQKVTPAKVNLSNEVGPALEALLDRVGLSRVRHSDGDTCRPGRESTPTGPTRFLGTAGGSNTGHASILTRLFQADHSLDHPNDHHYDNYDHFDDDDYFSHDHNACHDDYDDAVDHYDDEASQEKTGQSNQTPKWHVPLAISCVAGHP